MWLHMRGERTSENELMKQRQQNGNFMFPTLLVTAMTIVSLMFFTNIMLCIGGNERTDETMTLSGGSPVVQARARLAIEGPRCGSR